MANATEEKAQIQLVSTYKKPLELTYHPYTIVAEPGKPVTVTEKEARFWIGTGKFELLEGKARPAADLSPLEQLMKSNKDELIVIATDLGIAPDEAKALKKQDLAQLILTTREEPK